jgi:hypothetical protein
VPDSIAVAKVRDVFSAQNFFSSFINFFSNSKRKII